MHNTERKVKPPTQGMKSSAPSAREKTVARKEKDDKAIERCDRSFVFCFFKGQIFSALNINDEHTTICVNHK